MLNLISVIFLGLILLLIGTIGFYLYEKTDWITSFYDASTILTVVGKGVAPQTMEGKLFGSIYTLFIGSFYIFLVAYIVMNSMEKKID